MAPFLPVVSLSRSQNIRIGRSPNAVTVADFETFSSTAAGRDAQSGALNVPAYVDLGDPYHRRDLQHHTAIGAVIATGSISRTVTSDLYISGAAPTVTAGVGALTVSVGAFTLQSRTYPGATLAVPASGTIALAANPAGSARTDLVVVNNAGVYSVVQGVAGAGTPATPANLTIVATVVVPAGATSATAPTSATGSVPSS